MTPSSTPKAGKTLRDAIEDLEFVLNETHWDAYTITIPKNRTLEAVQKLRNAIETLKALEATSSESALAELRKKVEGEAERFGGENWKKRVENKGKWLFGQYSQGYLESIVWVLRTIDALNAKEEHQR